MTPETITTAFARVSGVSPTFAFVVVTLTLARVLPIATLAPFFAIPSRTGGSWVARAGMSLALAVVLLPVALGALRPFAELSPPPTTLAIWALGEAAVGIVFGLAIGLPLHALGWAGRLLDGWRGASLSSVSDPTGEQSSPLGAFMLALGLAIFFAVGAHRVALWALADAWRVAPPAAPVAWHAVALGAARLVGDALALAAAVAAPGAVTLVLLELGVGLVGRSAPQIPVFFAAMPLRAAAGLAALLLTLSATAALGPREFDAYLRAAGRLFGG